MKEETGPYWVDASLESEEMGMAVLDAMIECENVRMWALQEIAQRWSVTQGSPTTSELVPAMTQYIRANNIDIQRYSLLAALNGAVTDFNRAVKVLGTDQGGRVHLVRFPYPEPNSVLEIVFQARSVWRKYMAQHGRISTVYGSIFLEGNWEEALSLQATALNVTDEVFPYLIYSAALRNDQGEWSLRFNVHSPKSQIGKRKVRQKKVREQWA